MQGFCMPNQVLLGYVVVCRQRHACRCSACFSKFFGKHRNLCFLCMYERTSIDISPKSGPFSFTRGRSCLNFLIRQLCVRKVGNFMFEPRIPNHGYVQRSNEFAIQIEGPPLRRSELLSLRCRVKSRHNHNSVIYRNYSTCTIL